jgi:hypothetical protein
MDCVAQPGAGRAVGRGLAGADRGGNERPAAGRGSLATRPADRAVADRFRARLGGALCAGLRSRRGVRSVAVAAAASVGWTQGHRDDRGGSARRQSGLGGPRYRRPRRRGHSPSGRRRVASHCRGGMGRRARAAGAAVARGGTDSGFACRRPHRDAAFLDPRHYQRCDARCHRTGQQLVSRRQPCGAGRHRLRPALDRESRGVLRHGGDCRREPASPHPAHRAGIKPGRCAARGAAIAKQCHDRGRGRRGGHRHRRRARNDAARRPRRPSSLGLYVGRSGRCRIRPHSFRSRHGGSDDRAGPRRNGARYDPAFQRRLRATAGATIDSWACAPDSGKQPDHARRRARLR